MTFRETIKEEIALHAAIMQNAREMAEATVAGDLSRFTDASAAKLIMLRRLEPQMRNDLAQAHARARLQHVTRAVFGIDE